MKRKKLVSFKIGEVRIDIYDYTALDYMLEWISRLAAPTPFQSDQADLSRRAAGKIEVVYEGDRSPDFLKDNPWIEVLLSRGKAKL